VLEVELEQFLQGLVVEAHRFAQGEFRDPVLAAVNHNCPAIELFVDGLEVLFSG
jgi:hypothetical protein